MPQDEDQRMYARGLALALTAGIEMAAPIAIGIYFDNRWNTTPWLAFLGAIIGFGGGAYHLYLMTTPRKKDPPDGPKP